MNHSMFGDYLLLSGSSNKNKSVQIGNEIENSNIVKSVYLYDKRKHSMRRVPNFQNLGPFLNTIKRIVKCYLQI